MEKKLIKTDKICNLDNINDIIKKENLDLLVISYGGSASNTLAKILEKNNFNIRTKTWHNILCHCPSYIETDIPIIYIYDNFIKAFLSMKKRGKGWWDVNQQKMSNNKNTVLSDKNLIKLMINQFNTWTNIRKNNILIVKTCELFENSIVNKLECFLKKKINHFPIPYNKPKINIEDIKENNEKSKLFKKYKLEIEKINNFSGSPALTVSPTQRVPSPA